MYLSHRSRIKQLAMMICLDADCVPYSGCPGSKWIHNVQVGERCYTFCWRTSRQRLGLSQPRSEQGESTDIVVSAPDFSNWNQLLEWERVVQMVKIRVNSGRWNCWEIIFQKQIYNSNKSTNQMQHFLKQICNSNKSTNQMQHFLKQIYYSNKSTNQMQHFLKQIYNSNKSTNQFPL